MRIRLDIPHYSYPDLREKAEQFLRDHGAWTHVPVPIEEIIEFQMGIDIIPIPELSKTLGGLEAFISSDLTSITVDQYIYENISNRYRFSLAHEIGHAVLHRDVFSRFRFSRIAEYKEFVLGISSDDWAWLEWQSYCFGGLVLVPPPPLEGKFREAVARAESAGLSFPLHKDVAIGYISESLGPEFQVSGTVIEKRIRYDKLWDKLEEGA